MTTPRQDLISISARKIFEQGLHRSSVSAVVDDTVRECHKRIRDYYMGLSDTGLKRLDSEVWRRVEYLYSLESVVVTSRLQALMKEAPRGMEKVWVNLISSAIAGMSEWAA